jgi:hypothetical protein
MMKKYSSSADILNMSKEGYWETQVILSNIAAAECISRLVKKNGKKKKGPLSHLSRENNTPEVACLNGKKCAAGRGGIRKRKSCHRSNKKRCHVSYV